MGNPYEQWSQQGGQPAQQYPNAQFAQAPPTEVTQYGPPPQPEAVPYGPPPQDATQYGPVPQGGPPYWGPQYGGPPPPKRSSFSLGGVSRSKVAGSLVVISGLVVLIGSFFAFYSVTVTPSALSVRNNDAPSGQVDIGIGFYDVFPIPPPIVAQVIPLLMILAALTAIPAILGSARRISGASAVFAGAASLLAFVLAVSNPLPSVDLTGQLSAALEDEVGGQTVNQLVDSVVSIGPGAGLIVALVFSILGWAAATVMAFERRTPAQAGAPVPPPPVHGPNVPNGW